MKRKFFNVVLSLFLSFSFLFSFGCSIFDKNNYDYSKESITVTEVQKIAPCRMQEFLGYNDYTVRQLYYALMTTRVMSTYIVEVDGVEWSKFDLLNELPKGQHVIYVRTVDDFKIKKNQNGTLVEYPYRRAITITVDVSINHPDVCDMNYRLENNLWIDVKHADWYQDYEEKYLNNPKKSILDYFTSLFNR